MKQRKEAPKPLVPFPPGWEKRLVTVNVAHHGSTSVFSPAFAPMSRPREAAFISYREVHTEQVKPGKINVSFILQLMISHINFSNLILLTRNSDRMSNHIGRKNRTRELRRGDPQDSDLCHIPMTKHYSSKERWWLKVLNTGHGSYNKLHLTHGFLLFTRSCSAFWSTTGIQSNSPPSDLHLQFPQISLHMPICHDLHSTGPYSFSLSIGSLWPLFSLSPC